MAPHSLAMLNTANTEFSSIEGWFTDQNSKLLEAKQKVNFKLALTDITMT